MQQQNPPVSRSAGFPLLPFVLTLALLAPLTHGNVFLAGNDASRFAQIEALVDYKQESIDVSRYRWTIDRVTIAGRDYSNKPPLLALMGAGVYMVIKTVTGMTLALNENIVVYLLNLFLAVLPTAWLVARFHRALECYAAPGAQQLATMALAAGTILTSFSTTLNNHTVSAVLIFVACEAAWSGRGLAAGAWVALATCIDIVPGLVFAAPLAVMVWDLGGWRGLLRFLSVLGVGATVFVAVNLWIVGSPFPPKMVPGAVDHSSRVAASVAGILLPESWGYPFAALFGWHGFFSVSPVLLLGLIGMVCAMCADRPLRHRWTILLAAACVVMIAGHVLFVGSFGGWSYGFRYLIPIAPVLLFFTPVVLGHRGKKIFVPVLVVSVLFALLGAYHPWPPAYEQEAGKHTVASRVTNPVGGNGAAWMEKYVPGSGITDLMKALVIGPDRVAQEEYLALFYFSKGDVEMAQRMFALKRWRQGEAPLLEEKGSE